MSQDDVCYYPYMEKDGFARRIVIGEDGKPTAEMVMEDGSISTGPYDLIPILEDFIEEHPDFSYKGARAIIAFTGYEGILGYRTAASYSDSPNYEQDREQAAKVAQCLKDNGWELASHSWGHLWMGVSSVPGETFKISDERFYTDTDKWEAEVESLIGPTDIYIYPNGNDVADWRPYTEDNYRFKYLHSKGFRYFCNVDASKPAWIQKGKRPSADGQTESGRLPSLRGYDPDGSIQKTGCPISLMLLRSLMPHGPLRDLELYTE